MMQAERPRIIDGGCGASTSSYRKMGYVTAMMAIDAFSDRRSAISSEVMVDFFETMGVRKAMEEMPILAAGDRMLKCRRSE